MPNTRLNRSKNQRSGPRLCFRGRSNSAESAGLSERALNAEKITEIAIVRANCWYKRPVIPGRNAVEMNTAERTSAMPITGADPSRMAEESLHANSFLLQCDVPP